uniref:Protein lifeguard 4 n=1 Tax=Cacopsylla melanoneura TaxID=428564 RepID=A0A8D8WZF3_9HEMI
MDIIPLLDVENGEEATIKDDFCYRNNVANANVQIRLGFLRKVYSLLTMQLLATVTVILLFTFVPHIKEFVHQNDWLVFVSLVATIGLLIGLHVKRLDHPVNLYLMAGFTMVQALTLGIVVTYYQQMVVLQAIFLTFIVVVGLTSFTFQSKRDFSAMGSGLFAALLILIGLSIIQIFFNNNLFELLVSFAGAIIFSLFIIFDTHMIMQKVSAEEYILATINLYMDILNLFVYILRILEALNRQ